MTPPPFGTFPKKTFVLVGQSVHKCDVLKNTFWEAKEDQNWTLCAEKQTSADHPCIANVVLSYTRKVHKKTENVKSDRQIG